MHIMSFGTTAPSATALWLSDLHLDQADRAGISSLLDKISGINYSSLIVTGDISQASQLSRHLRMLAAACAPRPMHFVLGNHDYFGSGFDEVDHAVADLCDSTKNLFHLGGREIISLDNDVALIGVRGWADARAGYGKRTVIDSPDRLRIDDFMHLGAEAMLDRMRALGSESAALIRQTLPWALSRHRHVVIATHVPPFPELVRFNGHGCGKARLPHFTNLSIGLAIRGITRSFPTRRVTVLCGHTHSPARMMVLPNLEVRVAGAQTARPGLQNLIHFTSRE